MGIDLSRILKVVAWLFLLGALTACALVLTLPWDRLTSTHGILISSALYAGLGGWYLYRLSWLIRLSGSEGLASRRTQPHRPDLRTQNTKYWCTPKDIDRFVRWWERTWAPLDMNARRRAQLGLAIFFCLVISARTLLELVQYGVWNEPWAIALCALPFCILGACVHLYLVALKLDTRIRELERQGYF